MDDMDLDFDSDSDKDMPNKRKSDDFMNDRTENKRQRLDMLVTAKSKRKERSIEEADKRMANGDLKPVFTDNWIVNDEEEDDYSGRKNNRNNSNNTQTSEEQFSQSQNVANGDENEEEDEQEEESQHQNGVQPTTTTNTTNSNVQNPIPRTSPHMRTRSGLDVSLVAQQSENVNIKVQMFTTVFKWNILRTTTIQEIIAKTFDEFKAKFGFARIITKLTLFGNPVSGDQIVAKYVNSTLVAEIGYGQQPTRDQILNAFNIKNGPLKNSISSCFDKGIFKLTRMNVKFSMLFGALSQFGSSLTELHLSNPCFDSHAFEQLEMACRFFPNLSVLRLHFAHLTRDEEVSDLPSICESLFSQLSNLRDLEFSDCLGLPQSICGSRCLELLFKKNQLKRLSLRNLNFEKEGAEKLSTSLLSRLIREDEIDLELEYLNLGQNPSLLVGDDRSKRYLLNNLAKIHSLSVLKLDKTGLARLPNSVFENVTSLDLSENDISDWSKLQTQFPSLRELFCKSNPLIDRFEFSLQLQKISFANSKVTQTLLGNLMDWLSNDRCRLHHLDLSGCGLNRENFLRLMKIGGENAHFSLKELIMSDNPNVRLGDWQLNSELFCSFAKKLCILDLTATIDYERAFEDRWKNEIRGMVRKLWNSVHKDEFGGAAAFPELENRYYLFLKGELKNVIDDGNESEDL